MALQLVLVLLFVFYCATMLFYFGAVSQAYTHRIGLDIRPRNSRAVPAGERGGRCRHISGYRRHAELAESITSLNQH
jgi:hypothetical protein